MLYLPDGPGNLGLSRGIGAALPRGLLSLAGSEQGPSTVSGALPTDLLELELGQGARRVWVFAAKSGVRERTPVVVFLHGWGALSPEPYRAWLEHLARSGALVLFPIYQDTRLTPPRQMTESARSALIDALAQLERAGRVRPDRSRFALVGHSLGAIIAANLASAPGLPEPSAIALLAPGDAGSRGRVTPILEESIRLPRDSLLAVLVGDEDREQAEPLARRLFAAANQIPEDRKRVLLVRSDRHGTPPLVADHFAPAAPTHSMTLLGRTLGPPDRLDLMAYWRALDRVLACADPAAIPDACRVETLWPLELGHWNDGTAVRPMEVLLP